jgi:nitric oxide reductase subunit B
LHWQVTAVREPIEGVGRRGLLVSRGWLQAVALVLLCGFAVMGLLAYRTYTAEPPIPTGWWRTAGGRCSPGRTSATANRYSSTMD